MKAAGMNRRVAIERRTGGKGASGQPLTTWGHLGYLWADIAHDTGKAAIRRSGDVPVPYAQYSFKVRFLDAKALGVTDGDRATLDGDHFDIKGITRDLKSRDAAFLICELGGNEG